MNGPVILDDRGGVATLTLNRPRRLNSYHLEMLVSLHQMLERISQREDIRSVVITGAGGAFCGGIDMKFLRGIQREGDLDTFRLLQDQTRRIYLLMRRMPQVIIASINGTAAGGGFNLALNCDWRIASDMARLGYPSIRAGLNPELGAVWILPQIVGYSQSLRILTSGQMLPASRAYELHLVDEITSASELAARSREAASEFSERPPIVIRYVKQAIHEGAYQRFPDHLEDDQEAQLRSFVSEDSREGFEALLEQRQARFQGR